MAILFRALAPTFLLLLLLSSSTSYRHHHQKSANHRRPAPASLPSAPASAVLAALEAHATSVPALSPVAQAHAAIAAARARAASAASPTSSSGPDTSMSGMEEMVVKASTDATSNIPALAKTEAFVHGMLATKGKTSKGKTSGKSSGIEQCHHALELLAGMRPTYERMAQRIKTIRDHAGKTHAARGSELVGWLDTVSAQGARQLSKYATLQGQVAASLKSVLAAGAAGGGGDSAGAAMAVATAGVSAASVVAAAAASAASSAPTVPGSGGALSAQSAKTDGTDIGELLALLVQTQKALLLAVANMQRQPETKKKVVKAAKTVPHNGASGGASGVVGGGGIAAVVAIHAEASAGTVPAMKAHTRGGAAARAADDGYHATRTVHPAHASDGGHAAGHRGGKQGHPGKAGKDGKVVWDGKQAGFSPFNMTGLAGKYSDPEWKYPNVGGTLTPDGHYICDKCGQKWGLAPSPTMAGRFDIVSSNAVSKYWTLASEAGKQAVVGAPMHAMVIEVKEGGRHTLYFELQFKETSQVHQLKLQKTH